MTRGMWPILLGTLLAGCAARPPSPEEAPDFDRAAQVLISDSEARELARRMPHPEELCSLVGRGKADCEIPEDVSRSALNRFMTDYYRRVESRARKERAERPGFCVALSGGGIRSAAYSIGVLQGLADLGLDRQISVISATSGGGYALTWAGYAVATEKQSSLHALLRDSGAIAALEERVEREWDSIASRVATIALSIPSRLVSLYWVTVDQFIKIPLPSVDAPRISYEGMIRDTFMPQKDGFMERMRKNGLWLALSPRGATVHELRAAVDEGRMPLPIWTSTAAVGTPECKAGSLDKHVFELTPYRQGAHWLGYTDKYYSYGQQLSLVSAVAGAALDSPCIVGWRRILDLVVGRFGSTYPVFYTSPLVVDRDAPRKPNAHTFVRLIDGGDSENLAAYPLIRRLCERILMVDATEDPHLVFKSYELLRKGLSRQGIAFSVPGIDGIAKPFRKADQDEPTPECDMARPDPSHCLGSRRQRVSLFDGAIREIPYASPKGDQTLDIEVVYLKLAMDQASVQSYPEAVRNYWNEGMDGVCRDKWARGCQFPQDLTVVQRYPQARFQAYRELGRYHIVQCLGSDGKLKPECDR